MDDSGFVRTSNSLYAPECTGPSMHGRTLFGKPVDALVCTLLAQTVIVIRARVYTIYFSTTMVGFARPKKKEDRKE